METGPLPKSTAVSIVGQEERDTPGWYQAVYPLLSKKSHSCVSGEPSTTPFLNLCVVRKIVRECIACFALGLVVNSNGGTSVGFLTAAVYARLKA